MIDKPPVSWHCGHCGSRLDDLHEVLCDLAGKITQGLAAFCKRCKRVVVVGIVVTVALLGPIVAAGPREDRLEAPREEWGKFEITSSVTATADVGDIPEPLRRVFRQGGPPDSIKVVNVKPR